MPEREIAPFGAWRSPISVDMAVRANLSLREPRLDSDSVYWLEGRPNEEGRQVIVRWEEGTDPVDVTPRGFNARTMAHEYGGGAYAVADGTVYFTNIADRRIYRQVRHARPEPLTADGPYRYGDLVVDQAHRRLLCVREDIAVLLDAVAHLGDGARQADTTEGLVAIDLDSGAATVLAFGCDFYSTPRPTADGRRLAWLSWRHPNMPWDTNELWVADVSDDGLTRAARMIAGGGEESIVQPEWAPDGSLVFASDLTGWWNLYRWTPDDGEPTPLLSISAEFAGPQWVFGMRWFGVGSDGTIVAVARCGGHDELWMIPASGMPERIRVPDEQVDSVIAGERRVVYLGSSATTTRGVVLLDLVSGQRRVLRRSFELPVGDGYISRPELIAYPTTNGGVAHALYYPPMNADFAGPATEQPPLIVMTHGGPTSHASGALDLEKQYFTSRGFGVVDVDYRGSTGYGRDYMRSLDGQWGVYDVDDAVAAALFLADRGDVDRHRMAIRGGSAGGYTTLAALCFRDVFAAGASYYGVGDLAALARDTHKFESRYLDRLVAPYPQGMDVIRERSPNYFIDQIHSPLLVLQGIDDKVVPIAQAEELVASLRERRIPYAYLAFAGEGHGFRKAPNIRRALEAEISFYAQLFGFSLADKTEPIPVEFLKQPA